MMLFAIAPSTSLSAINPSALACSYASIYSKTSTTSHEYYEADAKLFNGPIEEEDTHELAKRISSRLINLFDSFDKELEDCLKIEDYSSPTSTRNSPVAWINYLLQFMTYL